LLIVVNSLLSFNGKTVFLFMALLARFIYGTPCTFYLWHSLHVLSKWTRNWRVPLNFKISLSSAKYRHLSKTNMKVMSQGHVPVSQHYVKVVNQTFACMQTTFRFYWTYLNQPNVF